MALQHKIYAAWSKENQLYQVGVWTHSVGLGETGVAITLWLNEGEYAELVQMMQNASMQRSEDATS